MMRMKNPDTNPSARARHICLKKEKLEIEVFPTRKEMGQAAAEAAAAFILDALSRKPEIHAVFAAAPSQNDLLSALVSMDLPWERINAWHMDEYVGLDIKNPQSFGYYLNEHIFSRVPFKSVHYIAREDASAEQLCTSYCAQLQGVQIDIVFMGIGENGHIAFNDPHVARFDDPEIAKIVELDAVCRMQQVHDGCFPTLGDVPREAITLTVPTLMGAGRLINVVPTALKAPAVRDMVLGDISAACPASACRLHDYASLYLDADSASLLLNHYPSPLC